MLRIVIEIGGAAEDTQGIKEKLAVDLECYGDVKVAEVRELAPRQMRLTET